MSGMLDQLAVALLSHSGSAAQHSAALDALHALRDATGAPPAKLVGDRWRQPWLDVRSQSLYTQPLVVACSSLSSLHPGVHSCTACLLNLICGFLMAASVCGIHGARFWSLESMSACRRSQAHLRRRWCSSARQLVQHAHAPRLCA